MTWKFSPILARLNFWENVRFFQRDQSPIWKVWGSHSARNSSGYLGPDFEAIRIIFSETPMLSPCFCAFFVQLDWFDGHTVEHLFIFRGSHIVWHRCLDCAWKDLNVSSRNADAKNVRVSSGWSQSWDGNPCWRNPNFISRAPDMHCNS